MANFSLSSDYQEEDEEGNPDPEGEARMKKVKQFALSKMAEAFRNWKKNLWAQYVKNDKKAPPEFKGEYVARICGIQGIGGRREKVNDKKASVTAFAT